MDRRGGCCIARYDVGGAYEEKKLMERAMLKFRPIAPKPTTGVGSTFGSSSSDNKTSSGETTYVKARGRGKRKYGIANKNMKSGSCGGPRKRVRASHQANDNTSRSGDSSGVVTLSLLPESPTNQNNSKTPSSSSPPAPIFRLSLNNSEQNQPVESVVAVDCVSVTDIWLSGGGKGLGRTDEERLRNLEWDMCPGFITDGQRRVKWINRAYKNMLRVDDDQRVVVRVENMKDDISWVLQGAINYPAFTCRVRVQHSSTKEVKILPCDVWRMDCGGLAWRLDVKAALSLGR